MNLVSTVEDNKEVFLMEVLFRSKFPDSYGDFTASISEVDYTFLRGCGIIYKDAITGEWLVSKSQRPHPLTSEKIAKAYRDRFGSLEKQILAFSGGAVNIYCFRMEAVI